MKNTGHTLIELLVTTTILGITLAYAIPSGLSSLQTNILTSEITLLVNHLHSAKMEAMRRITPVIFCPSANATTCDNTIEWQHGWMLFSDDNANGLRDANEPIIRAGKSPRHITIKTSRLRKKLTFRPSGLTLGSNATFTFCTNNRSIAPTFVILSNHGRIKISDRHPSIRHYRC